MRRRSACSAARRREAAARRAHQPGDERRRRADRRSPAGPTSGPGSSANAREARPASSVLAHSRAGRAALHPAHGRLLSYGPAARTSTAFRTARRAMPGASIPDEDHEIRLSASLRQTLREWRLMNDLRPANSREALPLDDPEAGFRAGGGDNGIWRGSCSLPLDGGGLGWG